MSMLSSNDEIAMHPSIVAFIPFQPRFDVIINPGHRHYAEAGTKFLRQWLILEIKGYDTCDDKAAH